MLLRILATNGELILDGTFLNKSMQVGIEEGENIIFSVPSVAAGVGAHTLVGNGVGALAAGQDPTSLQNAALQNPSTIADDIEILDFSGQERPHPPLGIVQKRQL